MTPLMIQAAVSQVYSAISLSRIPNSKLR